MGLPMVSKKICCYQILLLGLVLGLLVKNYAETNNFDDAKPREKLQVQPTFADVAEKKNNKKNVASDACKKCNNS